MIDCQLIIRENRQYRLNFPIYTAAEVASLTLAEDELPKFKGTVTEQLFWLAESFWPQVFPEEEDYFWRERWPLILSKQRLASAQLSIITLEKKRQRFQQCLVILIIWAKRKPCQKPSALYMTC